MGLLTLFLFGVLLPGIASARSVCVRLTDDSGIERNVPILAGTIMRLRFRHSIYHSQVEERFALQRDGFRLTQLRYGEARLVDFYGYENAHYDDGAWIVSPAPTLLSSLNLNTTADNAMSLHFDHTYSKPLMIQLTGVLRLTVATCRSRAHG